MITKRPILNKFYNKLHFDLKSVFKIKFRKLKIQEE